MQRGKQLKTFDTSHGRTEIRKHWWFSLWLIKTMGKNNVYRHALIWKKKNKKRSGLVYAVYEVVRHGTSTPRDQMSGRRAASVSVLRPRPSARPSTDVQPPRLPVHAVVVLFGAAWFARQRQDWWWPRQPWRGWRPSPESPFKSRYSGKIRAGLTTRGRSHTNVRREP